MSPSPSSTQMDKPSQAKPSLHSRTVASYQASLTLESLMTSKQAMPESPSTSEMPDKADGADNEPEQVQTFREEACKQAAMLEEDPPTTLEVMAWYLFGLCTYFVETVLLPVIFPSIITQIALPANKLPPPPEYTPKGRPCPMKEVALYERLVIHSIRVRGSYFSPLHWTAISWAVGILVSIPILMYSCHYLDHGQNQPLLLRTAVMAGGFFCLLTGFFRTTWLFLPCIVGIVVASAVGSAAHSRHLALMIRGFTKHHFLQLRVVASWLSLTVSAAGCVGAAIIAAFTYQMLRHSDQMTSLWVVSIFSGIAWFLGICHTLFTARAANAPKITPSSRTLAHILLIFNCPHAIGGLMGVFLSSLSSMCIFASCTLYVINDLCIKPVILLALWIIYFMFPMVSLPLLHPVQLLLRADAVRMQLLGFFLSAATSATGFYFKSQEWPYRHIMFVTLLQSTATGVLHAFGRVLLLDCSPAGKEGVFSVWHAWIRAAGTCTGFALASVFTDDVHTTFGVSFCAAIAGVLILTLGNVREKEGEEEEQGKDHVREEEGEEEEKGKDVVVQV